MRSTDFNDPPPLTHLERLTTPIGLLQHSALTEPDPRHGYSIDDNARALIGIIAYGKLFEDSSILSLVHAYLGFIDRAQINSGQFHNFADYEGKFTDRRGSQDSVGRTIWALGFMANHSEIEKSSADLAEQILSRYHFPTHITQPLRTRAFMLAGYYYVKNMARVKTLADSLIKAYTKNRDDNWHWFENKLTYSNAILPYSLFLAYDLIGDGNYLQVAKESLSFFG